MKEWERRPNRRRFFHKAYVKSLGYNENSDIARSGKVRINQFPHMCVGHFSGRLARSQKGELDK
jgi:hypothetical protein